MKNLLTILTIVLFSATVGFTTNPPIEIITSPTVDVISVEKIDIFVSAEFNSKNENLNFNTKKDISVVQIFNDKGLMEFQLPVMSDNVQINKNLFEKGQYKLGFILKGETNVHFTEVSIKE